MRKDLNTLKMQAFKKPAVKQEYERLKGEFEFQSKLIELRKNAKISQEELAIKMHTTKSSISRLESANSNPTIATLALYAKAFGKRLKIDFV